MSFLHVVYLLFNITCRGSGKVGGRGRGARGLKPPLSPPRGGSPPQIDTVPNCTSSNKIEIL